jgi:hypothetical protein
MVPLVQADLGDDTGFRDGVSTMSKKKKFKKVKKKKGIAPNSMASESIRAQPDESQEDFQSNKSKSLLQTTKHSQPAREEAPHPKS